MNAAGDLRLARRLERDRAHGGCDYVAFGGLPLRRPDPALAAVGGVVRASPGLARIAGLGLVGPLDRELLRTSLARWEGQCARLEVVVCPLAHRGLHEELAAAGWVPVEQENVLVGPPEQAGDPELRVERVGPERVAVWAAAARAGQELPPVTARELVEVDGPLLETPGVEGWVAWAGDEVAGAGALCVEHGLATLFAAGTAPAWRGRGVHRALLLARLARARALGADLVTMVTVPGSASQRNLERLGFAVQYTAAILARAPA